MDKPLSIFARLRQGTQKPNRRSLYRWFLANHDAFHAVVSDIVTRPDWETVTKELAAEGLTMKNGHPLTAGYARHSWWKAHKAVTASRRRPQNLTQNAGISGENFGKIASVPSAFSTGDLKDNNGLLQNRVNPPLKPQKLEARGYKLDSKQEAAADVDEEPGDAEFGPASLR